MAAIEIVRSNSLPIAPRVGTVVVELYIDKPSACAVGMFDTAGLLCAVGDNRPFAEENSFDPHADPSRSRVYGVLDFATGAASFRINPSCTVPGGGDPNECFEPLPDGQGNEVSVKHISSQTTELKTQFKEAAYHLPSGQACTINENLAVTPIPQTGDLNITGNGTSFPSIAVIHDGKVIIAADGLHVTGLCLPPGQQYNYVGRQPAPPPQPHPTGSADGVTVIITSLQRSTKNSYEEDLNSKGQFFVRMGVRVINQGSQVTEVNNLHFRLIDASHVVDETSQEGYGSKCGLSGNGDPGITLAPGADVTMPESLCFEPHGSVKSPFVVVLGLDGGGEVPIPVQ